MLSESIDRINSLDKNKELLFELFELYQILKVDKFHGVDFSEEELNSNDSHVKKLLYSLDTNHGELKFELMFFTGNKYTITHTHPEFVIDEVISGELKEKIFQCNADGTYQFVKEEVRSLGDIRKVNCNQGYPHQVIGNSKNNFTLCLTLGHDKVEPICESKIKSKTS